jgi:hypothetical protein
MPQLKQCEFFLLRYVPDAVKDEFVNLGVVLLDERRAELRFTHDWSRVRCIDPGADVEMLEALESDLRSELANGGREAVLKRLHDSFSNLIQLSPSKACLTESPEAELDTLAHMYLETSREGKARQQRALSARRRIFTRMREAFEQENVWGSFVKDIRAADYTQNGDPLKIDCGYRPNGVIKMFHALALETEPDSAKILAYSYPQVREGIARTQNLKTELTAIIDEKLDRGGEQVQFALHTLEHADIKIADTGDLGGIAGAARRDLRM